MRSFSLHFGAQSFPDYLGGGNTLFGHSSAGLEQALWLGPVGIVMQLRGKKARPPITADDGRSEEDIAETYAAQLAARHQELTARMSVHRIAYTPEHSQE